MPKLFWLDSKLVWREPKMRSRAQRAATPVLQRYMKRFVVAAITGTALGMLLMIANLPTEDFVKRIDVLLFLCASMTALVLFLTWMNSLYPDYIRITGDAVIRERGRPHSKPERWEFNSVISFAFISEDVAGKNIRVLRLNLPDGSSAEFEIGSKVSDNEIRDALRDKVVEVEAKST